MLVPESLSDIWKQRVRWSQGGQEVVLRHFDIFKDWRQRRIWPVYIEQVISVLWAYAWLVVTIYLFVTADTVQQMLVWFTYNSFALVLISHIQLLISLWNDARYDNVFRYYVWAAWYPVIYWMLNTFVVIAATPRAIRSTVKGGYATWNSPDRGTRRSSL
ncbi:hypothetical protein [Exiguobacterium sp. s150]|uniref:hypothetical protein n=1 Tax=Exiguobacterium sp. s150 TaxID=2751221 RepID=UPI0020374287|nr:hypothetical protein [Exiguobacterium sp. s150]